MITAMTLYSCCCCLYNSLILTFCDRDTLQRAYFVGTIISNSSSCIFLVIIALALHGHAPTIAFTREAYIFGFIIALLCAYPLWLHVPEAEAGERAEPVAPSNAVMAIVSGVQALAKNRCDTTNFTSFRPVVVLSRHLSPWQRPRIKNHFFAGSCSNLHWPPSSFKTACPACSKSAQSTHPTLVCPFPT
jgi:hypothetical protein